MNRRLDTQERKQKIYHVTIVGFVVNLLLSIFKLAAGIFGGSAAMVADAIHSASDFATDGVVMLFVGISSRPKDADHHYGHGKYETLASIIIGLVLAAVALGMGVESVELIRNIINGETPERPSAVVLIAAGGSILAKELLYRYTFRVGKALDSKIVIANAWHHRSDALSSVGTLVGVGCAYFLGDGWRIADPIAALLVSVMILKVAYTLCRGGIDELLEKSLPKDMEEEIISNVICEEAVFKAHNLRTRRIGNNISIEVNIHVDGDMSVSQAHRLTDSIEDRLIEHYGEGTLVSIHVEPREHISQRDNEQS